MAFAPGPPPKSLLGRHRVLSPTAAVKVSPLCLGTMNFGDAWKQFMGETDKAASFEMLDFFYDQGGNFLDTANNYQDEESEIWIGEWMQKKGVRDEMVLATKYTSGYNVHQLAPTAIRSNYGGNNSKSLKHSVEASLKKLQTNYIDLLYVHWWDMTTSIPELMQSLNQLVVSGKVLYLGVSDTPAWVVSKANEYARHHGLRQFSIYQGRWSAADRDFERDILGMTAAEGMALAPWGALGGGKFKTEAQWQAADGRKFGPASEAQQAVSKALEGVAARRGSSLTGVALAYVMHKAPYVFPVVGGRKIEHLKGNIEALALELDAKDFEEIEGATPFDIGFPLSFLSGAGLGGDERGARTAGDVFFAKNLGHFDFVPEQAAIVPKKP
ncbi:MAG: hypothetical protein M1832_003294 [Thelocarpon impressellum]|nr:MAG: hypothetical protein M1832_003294 [Thelocarpon impressellum]